MADAVHLFVRFAHVVGMALLLGGSLWGWHTLREDSFKTLRPFVQFEWVFWGILGVMLATGVGNLGTLGAPGPRTRWGIIFTSKLLVVFVFIVLSVLRTFMILRLRDQDSSRQMHGSLRGMYAVTAGLLLGIVAIAEVLAHG